MKASQNQTKKKDRLDLSIKQLKTKESNTFVDIKNTDIVIGIKKYLMEDKENDRRNIEIHEIGRDFELPSR